ncbi:GLPGLI family protein [Chryseobacterium sp. Tr-659]|uniref:GLPGLI family protein n=1 Tax=Chryseobacterium sp. Tr-659 TaxID=2608340 RepID=UPI00142193E3|nr:GLPGLI family protein [Chryseobacterium sp. Tr-659]
MKTTVFLLIFCVSTLSAQTHRYIYDLVYKPDSASVNTRKANYYLDINPTETYYFERPYFVSDSIETATGRKIFSGKTSDLLSKNLKTNEYTLFSIQYFEVYQLKDKPQMKWKIENETKTFSSLQLQKATTRFAGRNWVAWFSKEFPFQEGPYKFHGLPGMIIEIYDDKKNYHFTLNKSENFKETYSMKIFKNARERGTEIPYSKYQSLLMNYYQNPLKFIQSGQLEINENNKLTLDDGRTIYKPEELRLFEKEEQERLRKYNNPIELDKAIRYSGFKK